MKKIKVLKWVIGFLFIASTAMGAISEYGWMEYDSRRNVTKIMTASVGEVGYMEYDNRTRRTKVYLDPTLVGSNGIITAVLTFRAGNSGAGEAPAYFQAATALLASPAAGAMEVSTDLNTLYYTIGTGPARKTIAFTDSAMTGTVNGVTITSSAGSTFTMYAGSTLATSGAYTSTLIFQGSYTFTIGVGSQTFTVTP